MGGVALLATEVVWLRGGSFPPATFGFRWRWRLAAGVVVVALSILGQLRASPTIPTEPLLDDMSVLAVFGAGCVCSDV